MSHIYKEGEIPFTPAESGWPSDAKRRGNRVHAAFNRLCAAYVKKNHPVVAERLRKRAKKEANGGGNKHVSNK